MKSLYFFMIGAILLINLIMSKKVIVDSTKKMSDTAVYKWYILGVVIFTIPVILAIWTLDLNEPQPLFPFFLTLFFYFRAFMESRYIRETRRHLVSNAVTVTSLLFTFFFLLLRIL